MSSQFPSDNTQPHTNTKQLVFFLSHFHQLQTALNIGTRWKKNRQYLCLYDSVHYLWNGEGNPSSWSQFKVVNNFFSIHFTTKHVHHSSRVGERWGEKKPTNCKEFPIIKHPPHIPTFSYLPITVWPLDLSISVHAIADNSTICWNVTFHKVTQLLQSYSSFQ